MTDALARAVMSGSVEAVERLIKQGNVDLNRPDKKGRTPLYLAAFNGQATLLKFLLTAGADPNIVDKFGQSPVYAATLSRNQAAIKRLTEADADVNLAALDGTNPLSQCVKYDYLEGVKLMVKAGAKLTKAALIYLDRNGFEIAGPQQLRVKGAKEDQLQRKKKHAKGDPEETEEKTVWELVDACACGDVKRVEHLLIHGDDEVNDVDGDGDSPLYVSLQYPEIVKRLIAAGADVNASNGTGFTCAYACVTHGYFKSLRLLMKAKADVLKSHLVHDKWTPMSIAAAMDRVRAVRMFESAGVKVSEDAKNMLVQVKRAQQKAAEEARARCV